MSFKDWYQELYKLMQYKIDSNYLPTDPDDWCDQEEWEEHFKNGLTTEEAYYEEC